LILHLFFEAGKLIWVMKLNLSFEFFCTGKDKWSSLPPLRVIARMAIFCVEKGVAVCMGNDFCHDLSGLIVFCSDFENIGKVDNNFFVSRVYKVIVDLRKNAFFFQFFCEWRIL
jgi:hypothetical protein